MKKTSFTLKSQAYVSAVGSCCIPKWMTYCLAMAFFFFANQGYAQTFGGMSDCAPASGNAINNNCPVAPAPVNAGPTCMVMVPNLQPAGGFAMADVTVGAGYAFIAGSIQEPMPGALVGPGTTNIFVGAIFNDIGGGTGLCAVSCPSVPFVVTDVTPPVNNCMASFLVDLDPDSCIVTLTRDYLVNNMFNAAPSDNCTDIADLIITADVPEVGPMACGGANPQSFPFVITVEDESGNSTPCNAAINLRDTNGPSADFAQPDTIVAAMSSTSCDGLVPDLTTVVSNAQANCDGSAPTVTQFPAAGAMAGSTPVVDPTTGCIVGFQSVTVTLTDCLGNTTDSVYTVRFEDTTAPVFVFGGLDSCDMVTNDPDFPADSTLYSDGSCMVTIEDYTSVLYSALTDNCAPDDIIIQSPIGAFDMSGLCPPNNTISLTFTPVDCYGNMGTPFTCDMLLRAADTIPPMVVCPADPVTVVVPFDDATCEIGMAMIDSALLVAEGVTATDNCDAMPGITTDDMTMYTCSDIGKAGLTVEVQAFDCFGNRDTSTCAVEVVADDDLTAEWSIGGGDFIVCPDEFPISIVLGANTPGCGVWSGDVAVTGATPGPYTLVATDFPDLDADGNPDPGSYSITYTVGPVGCHAEITHNIQVSPEFDNDDAALVADFSICWEATETFDLEGLLAAGSVQGGAYTIVLGGAATGTQIGNLFQYNGGDGTLTVTYTLEDCDGDVESDMVVITIDEKPDGHFSMADDMCQDEGVETPNITGVPAGASVSFVSSPVGFVTNATTGEFDPAAGPLAAEFVDVTVTMTVSNGVCADYTISQVVRVYESGDPAFTIPATICESAAPLDLMLDNPNNDGGVNPVTNDNVTWTGTSVGDLGATGTFDPSVGPGVYTICVTVGAPSCEEEQCHDITVEPDYTNDDVALIDNFDLCGDPDESLIEFAGLLDVTALPGGVFSVVETGTLVGTVNPNSYQYEEGCGTLEITYSFPDDCDVPTEDVVVITIEQKPEVGGVNVSSPLCATDDPVIIDYSGSPEICGTLGVFSGPGVADGGTGDFADFDPAAAGEGQHDLFYDLNSPTGICNDVNLIFQVQVDAASPTDFTVPGEVCSGEVVNLALDNPDPSVLPASPDGNTEIEWFGGDGVNAIVTDNGDGTGTFVGTVNGTYTVCVRTGDTNCSQYECQQITVDITPPVLDCTPLTRTNNNDAGVCTFTMPGIGYDVTATDNCSPPNGAPVLTHDYAPHVGTNPNSLAGATFPVGITQVIWTATDEAGNSSNCTIEITIVDNEDPTVQSCPANITQGTDADICGAEISYTIPQFADNCDGPDLEGILVSGMAPGTDFPVGTTTVTWEYTDLADNATATCTFTVTVNDDDNPTPVCVTPIEVSLDEDGDYQLLVSEVDNASYDNCEVTTLEISRDGINFGPSVSFDCADQGTTVTVTLQATDAANNSATCTTDVTVVDEQVPDIECSPNIVVPNNQGACSAVVTYPAPTVTDNCPTTVTQMENYGGSAEGAQEVPAVTSNGKGYVSATVNTAGELNLSVNFSNVSANVVAAHIHNAPAGSNGPVIYDLAPLGFPTGTTSGTFNTVITLSAAQVAELTAGNLYVNIHTANVPSGEIRGQLVPQGLTLTSGSAFPVGITVQTYEVMDAAGNTESCSFTVTVNDEELPVLDCAPLVRTNNNDAGLCSFTMPGTGYDVTATDNCPGVVLTHDYAPHVGTNPNSLAGATFPVGITQVIWTANDCYGNSTSCTIEITIVDNEGPTVQSCPANITQGTDADICGAEIDYTIPQFADNCDGVDLEGVLVSGMAPGTDFPVGTTTVTWEYTDLADNATATCTFTVTVSDDDNPTPICSPAYAVSLDGDGEFDVLATDIDNASYDNCEIVSTLISRDGNPFAGSVTMTCADVLVSPITVTMQVTDAAGNTATCTTDVTVNDDQTPDIECPGDYTVVADPTTCDAVVTYPAPTVTDNCTFVVTQIDGTGLTSGGAFPVGTTVQTYQAEDIAGNIETCTFTVLVIDEVAPTIDCGPTVRTRSADPGMCSFTMPGAGFDAVGADNCPGVTITHNYPFAADPNTLAGTAFPVGSTTVTWIATDAFGNQSAICGIEIVVTDDEDPTIDCGVSGGAANALVNPSFEAGGPFNTQGADGWTQFGPVFRLLESVNPMAFDAFDGDVFMKMFDLNAGLFQDVAVSPGDELAASVWILNRATDEIAADQEGFIKLEFLSGGAVVSELESTRLGSTLPVGVWTEVSLNATVPAGVDAVRFVVISVKAAGGPGAVHFDAASLSITPPAPSNVLANASFEAGNQNNDSPGAETDNWGTFGAVFRLNAPPAYASDGNFFLKTFGGASGMFQDFPVTPGDELFGSADLQNASFDPTGAGQFGLVKFEFRDGGGNFLSEVEGPQFFAGDLPLNVWTEATVDAVVPPNAVSARFVVVSVSPGGGAVMMDNASATIGSAPVIGDVTVSNDPGACGADLAIDNPMADDNCGIVSIINDYNYTQNASGFYPVGTTVVGFTATDAAGNTADCTITVEVTDEENPEFVNCPTTMVMVGNDVDECSGKLNWSIPVATDNCEIDNVTQTAGPASGTAVPVGTAMDVTYTATDIYGNTAECTFTVQVVDTQNPTFDADVVMPADITVECDAVPDNCIFHGSGTPCEPLDNDDVMDNCTASADLVIDFTEVSTQGADPNNCDFYNYTLTRTWTVTDEAGNQLVHVQVITVEDTTPPVPACQDATIALDKFGLASINPVDLIAGTTDNCAPFSALNVVASQTDFGCADLGPNSVTLTITDPCGNTATCTVTVTVEEGPAPCTPGAEVATSCLNNATNLVNGQFEELITVTSLAMENWTVASASGTFAANSPAPPAAPTPVPAGTAFTPGTADGIDNDDDGQIDEADEMIYYTVLARFVEGIGYTATVTNGTTSIEVSNIAYYPTPIFTNLPGEICFGTDPFVPELEDQFAGAGAFTVIEILVNGAPVTQIDPQALGYGQHQVTVTVDANGFTPSTYIDGVNVPGTAATNAESRLDPGCIQAVSEFFLIVETPTQVVCNDLVHVTLEQDCESTITPDMVLEGTYPCFDDYSVLITTPAGVPLTPQDVVTGAHAGMELPYSLVHPISGNLCWGHILVEDKTNPEAICPPSVDILCTVDPDSIVNWLPFNDPCYPATDYFGNLVPINGQLLYLGEPDAIDCSDWTWEYTDDYASFDCAANPALIATITRTFVITDEFGNQGTCTQTINKVRGEVSNISFPPDLTFACNDPILNSIAPNFAPSVLDELFDNECGGNTQGWPEIWEQNLTTAGTGVCGLGITYSDELVNICPNSYKVVRTWKVHDWCPASGGAPTVTEYVQYIKVENVAPVITVDCNFIEPGTGYCILNATEPGIGQHGDCFAIYVPFAQVDAVCDEIVEVTVETQAGFTTNGGYIPSPGLPIGGPYDIVYRAEDQCGNISELVLTVVVEDKTAPTAVCDEITDVNLTSNGEAVIFAETFDDGSDDNCALQDLLVRRMTDNCGVPGNTSFNESVTFCCEDVDASPIMVVFRAVDYNGNWNECMVEVNVQDKLAPITVSCPPNERVTCDWFAENLETQLANAADDEEQCDILDTYFGVAQFFDNCEPIIECNVNVNVDQCLEGVVTRNYTVSDPSGNEISNQCNQIISVDHVSDWVVEFPADITVECGTTVPEFGEPEIFFETCELVAVSFEDEVFNVVNDACYKILRTWTVINWCVVGDEIDEEFAEDPENQIGLPFPQCDLDGDGDCDNRTFRDSWANGTYPGAADATTTLGPDTDFDSDPWDGYITYQQTIKVNDSVDPVFTNGCDIPDVCIEDNTCVAAVTFPTPEIDECSVEVTFTVSSDLGSGFGPFFNVAPGTYDVTYTVMDNCNNQSSCETTITVEDCKKPTPYCKNGIIVEIMNTTPPMIEVWASDLDAGSFDNCPGDLLLSFSDDTDDIGVIYGCDDIGQNPVELWVTDAAGNQDFCETFIIVQDNMGACGDDPAVAGLIATEEDEAVADVDVQLSGTNQMSFMTDTDGMYNFDVVSGGDYTVTPVKDDEPLNGVTTFDLVLITQHILGTTPLNSPYKMIAADANNSQSITTFDVLTLRKLILFIDLEFQNNTSWRFVDKDYSFPQPTNPWAEIFPEVISFNNISANQLSTDFVAVKVGDVNNSAALVAGSTEDRNANGTLVFNVEDVKLTEGQSYKIDFTAEDFAVMGYQFTLNFDQKALDFVEVVDAVAGTENFGLSLLEEGAITASWNKDNVKLADGETVFSLVFEANAPVQLSDVLSVNSRYTKSEAYQQNGDLLDVELRFNGQEVAGFELYQNTPNPFSSSTVIGFNMPEASAATLTITDVSGKVVKTIEGNYAKGYNEVSLERRDLPAVGILYYQLDSNNDSATRMMLLVD